ncbi:transcriptional regulator, TetR family [Peptoclostridium litorale DSM 5388]|uniref:HTH tetR-type domain-containing protein n=1 Tax=Peptoclostridium litorale DSM 5388 TaxID=1121324 RepID=A0A069RKI1_PEPLI|nr:TetR/AcrR family transcriptional regulator [Peptoclostridium litorale]KDR96610.1 hypothetical protein CLIT_2c02160 [Peptoclostridium litorale DSM 5388]SIN68499.1 transcriptional regulator, TetR family [Peptoclostridium litorale DSM 5388]
MNTREKIIDSSLKNFLIFGYENTSLLKVAEEVGIKKASIYYHFRNKEEIFHESIRYLISTIKNTIEDSVGGKSNAKTIIHSLMNSIIEFNFHLSHMAGIEKSHFLSASRLMEYGLREFPDLKKDVDNYYDYIKNTLMDAIHSGQKNKEIKKEFNAEMLAFEIISKIEGFCLLSSSYSKFNINIVRQSMYDNLWKLIGDENSGKRGFFKYKAKSIPISTRW